MTQTKILVVEDNRIVAEDIKNNLEEMGYSVSDIATSGETALKAVRHNRPDIAIMDIRLGKGMNGIETASLLWQQYSIPIIYLTAHADKETISLAKVAEPYAYLVKPFDLEELQSAVEIAIYKHRMERRVRESEQWLLTTLQSIGDGVIATDWLGKVKFMNPVAQKMTGWPQSEALGKSLTEIFRVIHEHTRETCPVPAFMVIETGQIVTLNSHALLVRRDGKEIPIKDSAAPIILKNGESIGVVLVFQDDSEARAAERNLRQLEKKLRQSQKMEAVGTLAGGIAHDFNNILASVIGYAELALEDVGRTSSLHYNLREILVAGLRARDLVRQILAFSRQAEIKQTVLNINELVREGIRLMRATIPTSIEIDAEITDNILMIKANPSKINQILLNLCTNAYHAMEDTGGTLSVRLDDVQYDDHVTLFYTDIRPGRYARMTVRDDGQGIPARHLEKIFDPYFTTKDQDKGTGLGLSIVNGIVASHKGYITVESRPHQGTEFRVFLPVDAGPSKDDDTGRASTPPRGRGERLLIVDDERSLALVQKQNLERLGYTVALATSSRDALERFDHEPARYDMLITDMTMPGMTGDRLVQQVREIRPDLPVILCTGFSDRITPEKCVELGIDHFLMKPIKKETLARAIREIFDG